MFPAGQAVIFLELVGAVERGKIEGCRQTCADAKPIDGCAAFAEVDKFGFVDAAASEYLNACRPPSSRMRRTLLERWTRSPLSSLTEPTAMPSASSRLESATIFLARGFGVVSVDQQDKILWPRLCEGEESGSLVFEGLDERMSHRAVERDVEKFARENRGCAGETCDVARASGHQPGIRAMARLKPKSTSSFPGASRTWRAAFEAMSD